MKIEFNYEDLTLTETIERLKKMMSTQQPYRYNNETIYNAINYLNVLKIKSESENKEMKTNTHIVIKRDDIFKYLTDNQINYLDAILNTIADGRKKDGKNPYNSYYICNTDEPYANEVLEVIFKAERSE